MLKPCLLAMLMLGATTASFAATDPAHPVKVSGAAALGPIFADPATVPGDRDGVRTKWFEMMASGDRTLSAGVYQATASHSVIPAYHEWEFMYFLKGGVTLTSADGTVTKVRAGDGVTIPKGWNGTWDTKGYTKFYVTYDPEAKVAK